MSNVEEKSIDSASQQMLNHTGEKGIDTAFDRHGRQSPRCKFGELGLCCRVCDMGPCRISPTTDKGNQTGVCGATRDTIGARNLIRQVAAGASAHSDHGFDIAKLLLHIAQGKAEGYSIKEPEKLKKLAAEWGVAIKDRALNDIAADVATIALTQWSQVEGEMRFMVNRPPKPTVDNWRKNNLMTGSVWHEIVETLHRTHEGVDADYKNLINFGLRTSLGDGWGGAMVATEISDIIFGAPTPIRSQVNLGVLEKDNVNIVVHGHEPSLSDMVVQASRDKDLVRFAQEKGAKGIMVGGICCTANEILMRQGAPVVGNFLNQELAMATGAVDVMLVDVQCIMPALSELKNQFHTKLITTSKKAKIPGAEHVQFNEENALTIAKQIIRTAIENFTKRGPVNIPTTKTDLIAGFTVENVFHHLGGKYRGSYRPLNDAIIAGRLRGVAAVIGCNTVKKRQDESHLLMVKELLKNDVLVVMTGCGATAAAKAGLLIPEAAKKYAGLGLQEICDTVGIPPVLHLGSCVDNSRVLNALCEMIKEGGLGTALSDLPIAGAAPEAMCEKAVAIGFYCVASGAYVNYAPAFNVLGSENLTRYLTSEIEQVTGGKFNFEEDPVEAARRMIDHMDKKRAALKLKPMRNQQPYVGPATQVAVAS